MAILPHLLWFIISHSAEVATSMWFILHGFPDDLVSHRFFKTSAINQMSGSSLNGSGSETEMSSTSIFSIVSPVVNFSNPTFIQSKWPERGHLVHLAIFCFLSKSWYNVRFLNTCHYKRGIVTCLMISIIVTYVALCGVIARRPGASFW